MYYLKVFFLFYMFFLSYKHSFMVCLDLLNFMNSFLSISKLKLTMQERKNLIFLHKFYMKTDVATKMISVF